MVGLSASAIYFYPHQVAVVRRVLTDPVQRYVLADEVGLGKTIEAGVLIKQHLYENPDTAVVHVLVPEHLVGQWEQELATKFFLGDSQQIEVAGMNRLSVVPARASMLVIDEAQHLAKWAFSHDDGERALFNTVSECAMRSERVLLLSGTPVLDDEDKFLAMLHLIDPRGYPLNSRDDFRRRVKSRQVVADALSDLSADSDDFFVEDALDSLGAAFADDFELQRLSDQVRVHLSASPAPSEREKCIGELRSYVAETYRLHRRLIRTRREHGSVSELLPQRTGLRRMAIEDRARRVASEFLEEWRVKASVSERTELSAVFARWMEASLSHPYVLWSLVRNRLAALNSAELPAFLDEAVMIEGWMSSFVESLSHEPRAIEIGRICRESGRRAIVFVDDPRVARRVLKCLEREYGKGFAMMFGETTSSSPAQSGEGPHALVVDRNGEDGLNLQEERNTDVVFYDMPMSPQRMEQRIGRVDRLEGKRRLGFLSFEAVGDYEESWGHYLEHVAKIFHRSIAPLQYVLASSMRRIRQSVFESGALAFDSESRRLSSQGESSLESEMRRIRAQDALDGFEHDLDEESRLAEALESATEEALEEGRGVLGKWLGRCLQFRLQGNEQFHVVHHSPRRGRSRPTLVPLSEALDRFGDFVDSSVRFGRDSLPLGPFSLDREVSMETGVPYLGVGHPFVAALERQIADDFRGTSWAFWRKTDEVWVEGVRIFLGFDLVLGLHEPESSIRSEGHGRVPTLGTPITDSIFPPAYVPVWFEFNSGIVSDSQLIDVLCAEYHSRDEGGKDVSLRRERWRNVACHLPLDDWEELCMKAAHEVLSGVKQSQATIRMQEDAHRRVSLMHQERIRVLGSRLRHLEGAAKESESENLANEARLAEALSDQIDNLQIKIDSIGAVVLSNEDFPEQDTTG